MQFCLLWKYFMKVRPKRKKEEGFECFVKPIKMILKQSRFLRILKNMKDNLYFHVKYWCVFREKLDIWKVRTSVMILTRSA